MPQSRIAYAREILAERRRQDDKWGEQNHPNGTGGTQQIQDAAFAREYTDHLFGQGNGTWQAILNEEVTEAYAESDPAKLREELIQVAAVAVAWVEAIDRRENATS